MEPKLSLEILKTPMLNKTKDFVLIAFLTVLLFLQEEFLTFLPNIQLTVFLLVLYAKKLGFVRTTCIILLHVFFDDLVMGSLNPIYMFFMFIGWMFIPILLSTIFKTVEQSFSLALCGILFAFLYSWVYLIPNAFIFQVNIWTYFIADIPFELLLATSSFLSILWFYTPCAKVFDHYLKAA